MIKKKRREKSVSGFCALKSWISCPGNIVLLSRLGGPAKASYGLSISTNVMGQFLWECVCLLGTFAQTERV